MNFWILAAASSGCSSYLCSNSVCAGICWDYLVCCRVEFALRWCEMMSKYTGSPCRVKQRLIGGLASGAQYWSFDWLLNWSRFVTRLSLPPPRVSHHCLPPNQSELPRPRGSLAVPCTQHHSLSTTQLPPPLTQQHHSLSTTQLPPPLTQHHSLSITHSAPLPPLPTWICAAASA